MKSRSYPFERHLIAVGAGLLGLFNVVLPMLPASVRNLGQLNDIAPTAAVDGSRFLLVIIGILLVWVAPGLWAGKRSAWVMALGCAVASALAHPVKNLDVWGAAGSFLLAGALLGSRQQFPARSDPPRAVRGLVTLAVGLAAVFTYSTAGLYFLDGGFSQPIPFTSALGNSFRLLFVIPATTTAEPITRHARWFLDSVRLAFLSVTLLGVLQLLQPVIHRTYTSRHERDRVRALLEKFGNSSIAYFALEEDKSYVFSAQGNAVLAYKVVGSNAVVLGDPIGDEAEFAELIGSFRLQCDLNGWACAFHQAGPHYLDLYKQHGLRTLQVGEEAVIDILNFNLAGREMKHLRSVRNRFLREGYRAEVLALPHEQGLLRRLREISDEWLALGRRRERTFTLGHFDEDFLQECEIMVARDHSGKIVAFTNIVPSYKLAEGNFDMLRYGEEPKGVSDFLYLSLIEHFRSCGFTGMNLGLVPFVSQEARTAASPAGFAMRFLYRHGGLLFRAQGLREFKDKFKPRWEPRYLVYGSDLQLPGIVLAIARAGELPRKGAVRRAGKRAEKQRLRMGLASR